MLLFTLMYYCHLDLNNKFSWCFVKGISGKSQILFAIVFTTRYLDLLTSFISLYNTCMKVRRQFPSQPWPVAFHTGPIFLLQYTEWRVVLCCLPGDLHRLCLCHSLPDLREVQGHLRWQPWQFQSGVPGCSGRRSCCSHQPRLFSPRGRFTLLCCYQSVTSFIV